MTAVPASPVGSVRAALVHVQRTHPEGAPLRRWFLDGVWPLRQGSAATRAAYLEPLEALLPVAYRTVRGARRLVVVDVRWITGWKITPKGRVIFTTAPAVQLAHLLGTPSPSGWRRSEGWPVKVVDLPVAAAGLKIVA